MCCLDYDYDGVQEDMREQAHREALKEKTLDDISLEMHGAPLNWLDVVYQDQELEDAARREVIEKYNQLNK